MKPKTTTNVTVPIRNSEPGRSTDESEAMTPLPIPAAARSGMAQQAAQPMKAAILAIPRRRFEKEDSDFLVDDWFILGSFGGSK